MFKSALSQIWKKYILKLNAWDLSLVCSFVLSNGMQSSYISSLKQK